MRNLLRLAVCTVAAIAAVACDKEQEKAEPVNPDSEWKTVTFTARLGEDSPQSKVAIDIDEDNGTAKVSFTAGDWIGIFDDSSPHKWYELSLTSDNINEDGSATFSVRFNSSSENYYLFCLDNKNLDSTGPNSCLVTTDKNMFNDIGSNRIPHAACAKCSSSSTQLTFKSVLTLIKFRIGDEAIASVKFTGNNDEVVNGAINMYRGGERVELFVNEQAGLYGHKTSIARTSGTGRDYFIALPPDITLSNGFTITACDASDNVLYTRTTSKEFKTVANKIYDIGVLGSAHDKWQAGNDITIGGVTYNKSTNGNGTLVKNGGTANGSGVFFIQNKATANPSYLGTAIYISNDLTERARLSLLDGSSLKFSDPDLLAFNRIDIETPDGSPLIQASGEVKSLVFDDCKVTLQNGILSRESSSGSTIGSLTVVNSDFIVSSDEGYIIQTDENSSNINNVTLRNNVFWSEASHEFHVIKSGGESGVRVKDIKLENNTFYNVDNGKYGDGLKPFFMLGLPGSLSAKANIVYSTSTLECDSDGNPAATARTAYLFGYRSESFDAKSLDLSNVMQWYGLDSGVGGLGFYTNDVTSTSSENFNFTFLDNSMMTSLTEDPFTAIDMTVGTYQKKETFKDYGADR